jgi:hypothetical protein
MNPVRQFEFLYTKGESLQHIALCLILEFELLNAQGKPVRRVGFRLNETRGSGFGQWIDRRRGCRCWAASAWHSGSR